MATKLRLFEASNGHLSLECGGLPESYWQSVVELLGTEEGLSRSGKTVIGAGDLLAKSEEGDHFLRHLHERLNNNAA